MEFTLAGQRKPIKIYTILGPPRPPWNATDTASALTGLTTGAYGGNWKDYDPGQTHTDYANRTLHLTNLLNDTKADCQDMAAMLDVFTKGLGCSGVECQDLQGPFTTHDVDPIGSAGWASQGWPFHEVAVFSNTVYDACARLKDNGGTGNPYQPLGTPRNTYSNDLVASGTTTWGTPFTWTSID